ncbi:homocysteine methyltransferase [Sorangium cellulosum]|uniref:Homocysteine methyltransferase n=1 Tax=Sorangium cellulosum TaxID=56 RepID=A0A150PEH8_SORCE|nr:homocysteine methyltransferase [Sorangium cellulosum]
MARYRTSLPQLGNTEFLTDGGLETTLIYKQGIELPYFAAFDLLKDERGRVALEGYFRTYVEMAREHRVGCVLESATWRASADWGRRLDISGEALSAMNRAAIDLLVPLARGYETETTPIVISGCVGPRGDGYRVSERMSAPEAEQYHRPQIEAFSQTEADLVSAITMNYVEEAIGIVRAASAVGMPAVVSFTVETDGRLPSGQALEDAILTLDAESPIAPAYYMINCAHPAHFEGVLRRGGAWLSRVRGLRANASTRSHAELDASTELDDGDPEDLGRRYAELAALLPRLNVIGGCCGTDDRHVAAMYRSCAPVFEGRRPS